MSKVIKAMEQISPYSASSKAILFIAEKYFFGSLSDKTKLSVRFLMKTMYWIDRFFDDLNPSLKIQSAKNIIGFLGDNEELDIREPRTRYAITSLKEFLQKIPEKRKSDFIDCAQQIFERGCKMNSTLSPKEFTRERVQEGINAADLVLLFSPQLGGNETFSKFLRELAVLGSLIDSFLDAREDKINGQMAIEPGQIYYSLVSAILRRSKKIMRFPQSKKCIGLAVKVFFKHCGASINMPWRKSDLDLQTDIEKKFCLASQPPRVSANVCAAG